MTDAWSHHFVHPTPHGTVAFREALKLCTEEIARIIENCDGPYSGLALDTLQNRINAQSLSAEHTITLHEAIKEVGQLIASNSVIVQHPLCIAHLHTPPSVVGIAAESFIAAQNLSMDSWDQSGAATYVEQRVIRELCDIYGFAESGGGVFTSGGTQSNIMALLMARDSFLQSHGNHSVYHDGLPDYAGKLRIVTSDKSHITVEKAAAIMGLGVNAVVRVGTHPDGSMVVEALEQVLRDLKNQGLLPFALVATAGTTDHGAIDDLVALSAIAKREHLWLHVDAAYGGAVIFSQAKSRLEGIQCADSLTVDFHKMWFQPISCGALLLRDNRAFKHLLHRADYLNRAEDELPNLVDFSVSTTRRFDALKVFMTLRTIGTRTLGAMVDHLMAQTGQVAKMIAARSHFELLAPATLTTVLFRYTGGLDQASIDDINKALRMALLKTGTAILGETIVGAKTALKLTLLNPCLTLETFEQLLAAIEQRATPN